MPYQNRVTPESALIAVSARGTLMGNRGSLHDAGGNIRRPFRGERWIICVLSFKNRHQRVMQSGHYTHLFFLDETTALAAGHRPCAECQRARFDEFRYAWRTVFASEADRLPSAVQIDHHLHADRLTIDGNQRTHSASLSELTDGVFIRHANQAYLWWANRLHRWTPEGYADAIRLPLAKRVEVLTPRATVGVLRAGFRPSVHPSMATSI